MIKISSALIISIGLAFVAAFQDYIPLSERKLDIYYYSFENLYFNSFIRLLLFFFAIVIPFKLSVDNFILKSFKGNFSSNLLVQSFIYSVGILIISLILSFVLGVIPEARVQIIIASLVGFFLFVLTEYVLKITKSFIFHRIR